MHTHLYTHLCCRRTDLSY